MYKSELCSCILKKNLGQCASTELFTSSQTSQQKMRILNCTYFTIRDDVVWYQSSCKRGQPITYLGGYMGEWAWEGWGPSGELKGRWWYIAPHWSVFKTPSPYPPISFAFNLGSLCVCSATPSLRLIWIFAFISFELPYSTWQKLKNEAKNIPFITISV